MELQGFGASLVGKALYVYANAADAWIPWEFLSDTQYSCKILVSSNTSTLHCLNIEESWTMVVYPSNPKDWSCIATILKGMGGSILLVFDVDSPRPPDSFRNFLETVGKDGRTVLTRIWIGTCADIPTIPDAIFFPVQIDRSQTQIYELLSRLPPRSGHREWKQISQAEWNALLRTTIPSNLGIVVSDIGETEWTLFWHKLADSSHIDERTLFQKGFRWLQSAMAVLEKRKE